MEQPKNLCGKLWLMKTSELGTPRYDFCVFVSYILNF